MAIYSVMVSMNSGEYAVYIDIHCNEIIRDEERDNVVFADGMKIEFEEKVLEINDVTDFRRAKARDGETAGFC